MISLFITVVLCVLQPSLKGKTIAGRSA